MWGFGKVRLIAFVKLSYALIREAWKQTREVSIGDKLECTITMDIE